MRRLALFVAALGFLTGGCAYEFTDGYFGKNFKFRRDFKSPLEQFHDLDYGKATVVLLGDQVEGMNMESGETIRLGIELNDYDVGVPIIIPSDSVVIRFSELDGIPATRGSLASFGTGKVLVLAETQSSLTIQFELELRAARMGLGGDSTEEIYVEGVYDCQRLPADIYDIIPFWGGRMGSTRDDWEKPAPPPGDRDKPK